MPSCSEQAQILPCQPIVLQAAPLYKMHVQRNIYTAMKHTGLINAQNKVKEQIQIAPGPAHHVKSNALNKNNDT